MTAPMEMYVLLMAIASSKEELKSVFMGIMVLLLMISGVRAMPELSVVNWDIQGTVCDSYSIRIACN